MKVAILDDFQNVALSMADWSGVRERAGRPPSSRTTSSTRTLSWKDSAPSTWFASCASGRRSLAPSSSACHDVDVPKSERAYVVYDLAPS